MYNKRVVITGMSINTPLGDVVDIVGENMLNGKSAITSWKGFDTSRIYSKIGGDLSSYDVEKKLMSYQGQIPDEIYAKAKRVFSQTTRDAKLSILMSLDAYLQAKLFETTLDPYDIGVIGGGSDINQSYIQEQYDIFKEEPDFIDGLSCLKMLDTDHPACVSEVLNLKGMIYTVGGVCATGNIALKLAHDSILFDDKKVMLAVCPVVCMSSLMLQALSLLDAITHRNFNNTPEKASRPYDTKREGFVPCEGGAVLVLEEFDHAKARGAPIHAEILATSINSDANHLGNPSQEGQARMMGDLLKKARIAPQEIGYISAHATSTQLGDITEIRAIKNVFGRHANNLIINAPKSLLGHTAWAAGAVEAILAIWQMNRGIFHQSHNIDELDPEIDLDVCATHNVEKQVNIIMNNSFGMGGFNSAVLFKRYDE